MTRARHILNRVCVAAWAVGLSAGLILAGPAALRASEASGARESQIAELLEQLAAPEAEGWRGLERRIVRLWSRSGSASADLLLQRGREALRVGDSAGAIGHLTALVDHAPEFAEGWHARASAYYMAGLTGPALADIQQVLILQPRHFGALIGLGVILESIGLDSQSLDAYRAAGTVHPHRPDIQTAMERLEQKLQGTEL